MLTTLAAEISPRRRRHFRYALQKDAVLKNGTNENIRCRVLDATTSGVRVEYEKSHQFEVGTPVTLDWPIPVELKGDSLAQRCRMPGKVVRVAGGGHTSRIAGIRFDRSIQEQLEQEKLKSNRTIVFGGCALVIAAISLLKVHNVTNFWYAPWLSFYSLGAVTLFTLRIILSWFYKVPGDHGYFPTVSIVIAAKNEEDNIAETIEHCFKVNYPPDLIEVFAVDDGSTDNTWAELQKIAPKYPNLRTFRFEKNKGKRHAMALGAEKASGEILVYVDSDSFVDPDGLYRLVQPFAEPNIGAVAGHVLVTIEDDNFISKMEAIRYYISHRIMKAAESVFGLVTCCPGAFSAYRRSAVMRILPMWANQTFLGTPATFGDDRSLTNYILKDYDVIFHLKAYCRTYCPRTLKQFFRQQLRWKKSWTREMLVAARIVAMKHPLGALVFFLGVVVTVVSPIVALRALVIMPILASMGFGFYLLGIFLVYLFLCLLCLYDTQSRYWYYGLAFAGLYLLLSLQNYYAFATVRRNHWGTR